MARSRVEVFEQIRRDRRIESLSIRELANRHGVHRRTVRQALASAVPPPRKQYPPRPRPAIGPYAEIIDGWLIADQAAPLKQRHTARRIWQRLVAEHGARCSEVTVSRYVAHRRPELGMTRVEVAVPQAHEPGAEAEVDFGEFWARIGYVPVLEVSHGLRWFHTAPSDFAGPDRQTASGGEKTNVAGIGGRDRRPSGIGDPTKRRSPRRANDSQRLVGRSGNQDRVSENRSQVPLRDG